MTKISHTKYEKGRLGRELEKIIDAYDDTSGLYWRVSNIDDHPMVELTSEDREKENRPPIVRIGFYNGGVLNNYSWGAGPFDLVRDKPLLALAQSIISKLK